MAESHRAAVLTRTVAPSSQSVPRLLHLPSRTLPLLQQLRRRCEARQDEVRQCLHRWDRDVAAALLDEADESCASQCGERTAHRFERQPQVVADLGAGQTEREEIRPQTAAGV